MSETITETREIPVAIKILDKRLEGQLPARGTPGSAGYDIRIMCDNNILLNPGQRIKLPSGIAIHIEDPGIVGLIVPRSGLGSRGLVLSNLTGVIDSDYTGEIQMTLWNAGKEGVLLKPLDRVAQLLFVPVFGVSWKVMDTLDETERGGSGFGSTGTAG